MPHEIPKGYLLAEDGSWCHPSRLGRVAAGEARELQHAAKASPAEDLQGRPKAQAPRRPGARVARIRFVAFVREGRNRIDDDNLMLGFMDTMKPIRDSIAQALGVDDNERFVAWEYRVVKTVGAEGIAVTGEAI